jgi:hypothetical protein
MIWMPLQGTALDDPYAVHLLDEFGEPSVRIRGSALMKNRRQGIRASHTYYQALAFVSPECQRQFPTRGSLAVAEDAEQQASVGRRSVDR